MTKLRYSANGGFNDTHLYVKYPDFPGARPQSHVTAQQYATARRETEQGLQMPRPGPINFAALVPVLAEPLLEVGLKPAFKYDEARESARQTATKGESSTGHSRGGRSISDFAGGIADGRTAAPQHVSSESETCTELTISGAPHQSRGSRYRARPASKLSGGRWG